MDGTPGYLPTHLTRGAVVHLCVAVGKGLFVTEPLKCPLCRVLLLQQSCLGSVCRI